MAESRDEEGVEESTMSSPNLQFPLEDIETAIDALLDQQPFITTKNLAEQVGCTQETARVKLNSLYQDGRLQKQQVGGRAKVWYPSEILSEKPEQISGEDSSGTKQKSENVSESEARSPADGRNLERVLFFPSRREIVVDSPKEETQGLLSQIAHLVDSNGDGFLYKIDEADVWNAPYDTIKGLIADLKDIIGEEFWDGGFESRIRDDWERAHQFTLKTTDDGITVLKAKSPDVFENVAKRKLEYGDHYTEFLSDTELRVTNGSEAGVKETLYEEGYPVIDNRRLEEGESLNISLSEAITLRNYQGEWVSKFVDRKSGVFVGPSGCGKTVAAIGTMNAIGGETLIIVPNRELVSQWREELLETTNLSEYQIGRYHGGSKNIRPVTIATYDTAAMSRHREIFNERNWGLIIADECHHSVASTWKRFREIQSKARLGLSATPVRESEDSQQIYTLIGPPIGTDWGTLFSEGWVEKPEVEILMVPWGDNRARERYQRAQGSKKMIEAARNPAKVSTIENLREEHSDQKMLIFVDWIKQGKELSKQTGVPFIYGETAHDEREEIYEQFRDGGIDTVIISRIGDEGIDLPDAEVAILASTMGSSRSQTGQRTGRTMRPFGDAKVYVLLTKGSGEEEWGRDSTQYLAEKGIDVTKTDLGSR